MALSTIAEEASFKDNNCVQTVNIDCPLAEPQMQPYRRTVDSPAAILGLISLGTVFLSLSIPTLAFRSVNPPSLIVVIATFYGGISQTIVAIWEISLGNTFSATVFATYGGFDFVYSAICLPRISLAGGAVGQQFYNAIGIYLGIWGSTIFLLLLGALQTNIPYIATHAFIVCALACLSLNAFTGPCQRLGARVLGRTFFSCVILIWSSTCTGFAVEIVYIGYTHVKSTGVGAAVLLGHLPNGHEIWQTLIKNCHSSERLISPQIRNECCNGPNICSKC
ncbi:GPR1/FUN34/yaaH family-domain-containing protein [Suillus subaureus]|uniref:GPR1/FUN34/yaaH family-domain-containing protein n=1 Tax=Suillus subaureus TaxID=48587 RepID=A0A9P7EBU2_9AGAM|nr:GPR1/FUN34/yaaH family-domain-containing protein [Suillus subaureus]KAG1816881.1 GPR1/FUN34/yaaH family-domain-containing protein [Suillus subaureus]